MAITLDQLIATLPTGTERQVRRTVDRGRHAIREAMRAECGLSMQGHGGHDDGDTRAQVPISVVPGYPESLPRLAFADELTPVLMLAQYGRQLAAAASAVRDLILLDHKLRSIPAGTALVLESEAPIAQTGHWAERMLKLIEEHDPVTRILAFNEDVLGVYKVSRGSGDEFTANPASIQLYWGVIGVVSRGLQCTVEDLTVVVLAHEVAHAYTQLGADTDGRRWPVDSFDRSEDALVEGLAQYYAERTLKRMRARYPEAHDVFLRLMAKQPPQYRAHEPWAPHVAPEAVRRAMLEVRRWGEFGLADFERRLERAGEEFLLTDSRAGRRATIARRVEASSRAEPQRTARRSAGQRACGVPSRRLDESGG